MLWGRCENKLDIVQGIYVPTYRQARNMLAIRIRMHWHTELTGACQVYAEIRVSSCASVRTVGQTFEICGLTVTNNAVGDLNS